MTCFKSFHYLNIEPHWRSLITTLKVSGFFIIPYTFLCFILFSYLAATIPISYDEATTFNFFVEPGFITSVTYYPAPNNHIFYSFVSSILKYLPIGQTFSLRLFSITSSVMLIFFSHHFLLKIYSKKIAIFGSLIFVAFPGFLKYSFLARGYSLTLFLFLIGFYALYNIIYIKNEGIFYSALFVLSSILGLYSVPSYLYGYGALVLFGAIIFIYQKNFLKLKSWMYVNVIAVMMVGVFYFPIIYFSGIDSLINNRFVEPISTFKVISNLYAHFNQVSNFLIGFNLIYLLSFLLILLLYFYFSQKKEHSLLIFQSLFVLIVCPIFITLQSVIPFDRTWLYLSIPILFVLITVIYASNYIIQRGLQLITIFYAIFIFFNFLRKKEIIYQESFVAEMISNIVTEEATKQVYFSDPILNRMVSYNLNSDSFNVETGVRKPDLIFSKGVTFVCSQKLIEDCKWEFRRKIDKYFIYRRL